MICVIDKPVAINVLDSKSKRQRPDWPSLVREVEAFGLPVAMPDFAGLADDLSELKLSLGGVSSEPSNRFEALGSKIVHMRLRTLPPHILCDAGFWRWISLFHLYDIVQWRMDLGRKSTSPVNFGIGPLREGVIARMYLRAEVSFDSSADDPYWLSQLGDIDFFRSHIFRTNYGMIRPVARAMIRKLFDPNRGSKYSTKIVRELAKQVNRLAPIEALELLTDETADKFIERELAGVKERIDDI